MKVKLWGTCAQVPALHPDTQGYGGNTICQKIAEESTPTLILDAGMGLRWLGNDLLKGAYGRGEGDAHVLLTHVHWDHIQGLPFFTPMLIPDNRASTDGPDAELALRLLAQMRTSFCPVPNFFIEGIGAEVDVVEVGDRTFNIGSLRITASRLNHCSMTCLGYRVEAGRHSVAYLPDVEYLEEARHGQVAAIVQGMDLLFHDAVLTAEVYFNYRGSGYCSIDDGIDVATHVGVRRLVLFGHHPDRNDAEIDQILATCSGNSLQVGTARKGSEYILQED